MTTRQRSPNYPRLSLEAAIRALKELYQGIRTGEFNQADAAKSWGHSSSTGATIARLSSLRQYGLIDGKRGSNPKISRTGHILVVSAQTSNDYEEAVRQAALTPPLFRELHESKPEAADEALRAYLLLEKQFTETGAARVISVYRDTLELAQVDHVDDTSIAYYDDDISPDGEGDESENITLPSAIQQPIPSEPNPSEGMVKVSLIGSRGSATFELPTPVPSGSWDQMIRMIEALKTIYVQEEQDEKKRQVSPAAPERG